MRNILKTCLLALLLAGCGSQGGRQAAPERGLAPDRPVAVAYPSFGDADPHGWQGRSPSRYAVHGIDVSRWQGRIDWPQARAAGVSFAFIKATEGVEEIDPMFDENWHAAGRAGVPRGAYHFFYFCASAAEQARWFIRNVPRAANSLPHVLDLEWNHRSPTCRKRPDGATVRAETTRFLDILEAHYGHRPLVYTTPGFVEDTGILRLPHTQFWLRSVADHPRAVYPGSRWTFWQYSGTGLVPGIAGKVDLNVFYGSVQSWKSWGR